MVIFYCFPPFKLYAIIKYFKSYSDIEWQFSDTVYHLTQGFMYLCLFFFSGRRVPFSTSRRQVHCWRITSALVCLGKPFLLLHIRMTTLLDSVFSVDSFSFNILRTSTFLLASSVSARKSTDDLIGIPLWVTILVSLAAFKIICHWLLTVLR